jgi:internalin A
MDGRAEALRRIAEEAEQKTGTLDLGGLELTEVPAALFELTHLRELNLGVKWVRLPEPTIGIEMRRNQITRLPAEIGALQSLAKLWLYENPIDSLEPLRGLGVLQALYCGHTRVSDLRPLMSIDSLRELDCSQSAVHDLSPVASLTALKSLNFRYTDIADLHPLAALVSLRSLYCNGARHVCDLSPLTSLRSLETLDCSHTAVTDLRPLSALDALQRLDCSCCGVSDLMPLAALTRLRNLNCASTSVSDLTPLASLTCLESLDCSRTRVSDARPLASLVALQDLNADGTRISDASPLVDLDALKELRLGECPISILPERLLFKPTLEHVSLDHLPGAPAEVLSHLFASNCLERLRAHVRDLEAGSRPLRHAKVFVLGNGRVGKTQLCRRLLGLPFDEDVPSTHGITVTSTPWVGSQDRLNLWDFGGQDIYHGTHALFMRTRAIFIVVWDSESERTAEHEHEGLAFRNHPLSYWLDYVRTLGGANSPVMVVQTRCDRPEQEVKRLPVTDALADAFLFFKQIWFSAKRDRGRGALQEAMCEAIEWLRERPDGLAVIGRGRLGVLEQLERWRDADQLLPPAEREHRTLSTQAFANLCEAIGGVSSPQHLLQYLHAVGAVFHQPEHFGDQIILDQSWALEAVYAVFERRQTFRQVSGAQGCFTRSLLGLTVWQTYTEEQQQIFLGLMLACGICFERRASNLQLDLEAEYVAPDLLPDKAAQTDLAGRWDEQQPALHLEYDYSFLHPGLMRNLVCDAGKYAGEDGVYWKYGVWVYEQESGCRALIEQHMLDDRRGRVVARVQGARPDELCHWIRERILDRNRSYGYSDLSPSRDEFPERAQRRDPPAHEEPRLADPELLGPARAPAFAPLPPLAFPARPRQIFVSYAWGDATPEGRQRERVVDALCARMREHGVEILRDKEQMRVGDRISEFMKRLTQGDLIIAVISDKYLRSPFCMSELFRIFRAVGDDAERFLGKVIPVLLPDARLATLRERLDYAAHWKAERDAIDTKLREHGVEILGPEAFAKYDAIRQFAGTTSNMLELLTDKLVPRDLERLERDEFRELLELMDRAAAI